MKKISMMLFVIVVTLVASIYQFAGGHPGGLDTNGGHYNRKTGEYHYHRGGGSTPPSQSPSSIKHEDPTTSVESISTISETEKTAKINDYFRAANENVGALACDVQIHERDVNEATKSSVKRRDGNKCVICGSMKKLEVDHRRALMNGGTNDMSNLFTLCDDCHTIKTKYDNSLRRKRNANCRGKR